MQGNDFEISTKEDSSQSFIFGVLFYWQLDRVAQEPALMATIYHGRLSQLVSQEMPKGIDYRDFCNCANHSCSSCV